MTEFDVCVVGGGPAGSAAALTLARYTRHRVCLIEASHYETARVGETVSAGIVPLLGYLGAESILSDEASLPSFGSAAAWGSDQVVERDFIFSGRGQGLHLDRRRFDQSLCGCLEAFGCVPRLGVQMRELLREGDGWIVMTDGGENLSARQVIDATGRQSRLARRLGAERLVADRLVGLVCHVAMPDQPMARTTLVEAVQEGWWYTAPLPGGHAVVALMTDADLLRGFGISGGDDLLRRAAATRHTGPRLHGARPLGVPRVFPAESHVLHPSCGPGWVAAGDAACAFDPLTSLGIGYALTSGIQAARIADQRLRGEAGLAEAYPGDIARHALAYATQSRAIYAAERRWPDAPFWLRRRS